MSNDVPSPAPAGSPRAFAALRVPGYGIYLIGSGLAMTRTGAIYPLFAALLAAGLTEAWIKDMEVEMAFWALLGAFERSRLERAPRAEGCGPC